MNNAWGFQDLQEALSEATPHGHQTCMSYDKACNVQATTIGRLHSKSSQEQPCSDIIISPNSRIYRSSISSTSQLIFISTASNQVEQTKGSTEKWQMLLNISTMNVQSMLYRSATAIKKHQVCLVGHLDLVPIQDVSCAPQTV